MTKEEEDLFQKSNNCWICKKLIDNDEDKVRDHCHRIFKNVLFNKKIIRHKMKRI